MMLHELKVENTHYGTYLLVKTTSLRARALILKDEEGNIGVGCLNFQGGQQMVDESLGIAEIIII